MRRYEVAFVLAPTLSDAQVDELVATFSKTAQEKGAEIVSVDRWGKRKLAFPVGKFGEGIYVIVTLSEPSAQAVTELERRFKVTESVIRFLTVRTDQDLKRADKFKSDREARKKKRAAVAPKALEEQRSEVVVEEEG